MKEMLFSAQDPKTMVRIARAVMRFSVPFDTLVGELDRVFWTQSHAGMFGDDINTMLLVKEEWLDEHY